MENKTKGAPRRRPIRWGGALCMLMLVCALSTACAANQTSASETTAEPSASARSSTGGDTPEYSVAREPGETLLHARNATFRFANGIGFQIKHLVGSVEPTGSNELIILDDPTSFSITAIQGQVLVQADEIATLFNEYTFAVDNPTLRDLNVSTRPGRVTLSGQYRRRGWVDFEISGTLSVKSPDVLMLTADRIVVEGDRAGNLLEQANVKLDAILDVQSRGLTLVDNRIELDAEQLFPPPQIKLSIASVEVDDPGILLTLESDRSNPPELADAPDGGDSYLLLRGGDIRIMRTVVPDADIALLSSEKSERFGLWLYEYRRQLVNGFFDYRDDPEQIFIVRLPRLPEVASP